MVKRTRPHAGSLAFYPMKRAARETPSFRSFPGVAVKDGEKSRPLNFLGYKAGMTHVLGKDLNEKGVTAGHEVAVAVTVLEAPPMRVFGVRAMGKAKKGFYGTGPLMDVLAGNVDKNLLRRMHSFKRKGKRAAKAGGEKKPNAFEDLEKAGDKILDVRLLCHSQPGKTGFGKKKPDVCEVALSGSVGQQLAFAKEKLGHELAVSEVFGEKDFVDVKAVSKGKGMQGPVKRAGVKTLRPKSKKTRVVGSIGPWHPNTIMWQVARPGQLGYQIKTEYNKRVLKVGASNAVGVVNQEGGFKNYGALKSDFVVLAGSVIGPSKRAIGMRVPIRPSPLGRYNLESLDYIAGTGAAAGAVAEEEVKAGHVVEKKEEKKGTKSVADEIAAAAGGGEKREKPKGN
ncbi:MAG: 50S ribosomal protein L3 [archaeon]